MCLPGTVCFDNGCLPDCSLCHAFTVENLTRITNGAQIPVASLKDMIELASLGCNFCGLLVNALLSSDNGNQFLPKAIVLMEKYNHFRTAKRPPGKLDKIDFKFENPMYVNEGGLPQRAHTIISQTFTLGLYSSGAISILRKFEGDIDQYAEDISDHVVLGRPANPVVSSAEAFKTAKEWIQSCLNDHEECPNGTKLPPLPTRVIDVRLQGQPAYVNLHISNGQHDLYAALSYSWGSTKQVRTEHANLEQHQKGLLVESLPRTIQDAIRTTRELMIPYLWVDSLCIIQDSVDDALADWPREAARMPQVYKNATVTISAASAADCDEGFLEDRIAVKDAKQNAFRLPLLDFGQQADNSEDENEWIYQKVGEVWACADEHLGYSIKDWKDEPINSRAWTLQESWLAPRLLIYGSGPLKWKCLSKELTYGQAEHQVDIYGLFSDRQRFFRPHGESVERDNLPNIESSSTHSLGKERGALLEQWARIVHDYTGRDLTHPTDKLPAISSVAAEVHRLLCDKYIAGLWSSTLPHSLLWKSNYRWNDSSMGQGSHHTKPTFGKKAKAWVENLISKGTRSRKTDTKAYIAPSWSPLHNNGQVVLASTCENTRSLATIDSISTTMSNPSAPFGSITDGTIELTAPMARMTFASIAIKFVIVTEGSPDIYWDYIIPDNGWHSFELTNMAIMQSVDPTVNPQLTGQEQLTGLLQLSAGPRAADVQRPVPVNRVGMPFFTPIVPSHGRKSSKKYIDLRKEFWLLEIVHSNAPAGLVLVQLHGNVFERIGMFYMGRNLSPQAQWVDGLSVTGPRQWDWDRMLEMRRCIIR